MLWGYAHLATTIALALYTRKSEPHYHAAISLLVWLSLRNLGYQYNVYEYENVLQTMAVFLTFCIICYWRHRNALFVALVGVGGAVCVFNELHSLDVYWAKTVLGALFQLCVVMVFIACYRTSRPVNSNS